MINNKVECINLEEFTGKNETLTLEVCKQKKNGQNEKIRKIQSILIRSKPENMIHILAFSLKNSF